MNAPMQQLTCPKCRGAMTSYERSGIVIDQCTECRGVFLDRGELERLLDIDAGNVQPGLQPQFPSAAPDRSWRGTQPQARAYETQPQARQDWDDDSDSHRGRSSMHGATGRHGKPKKRHSMLKDLLDF